MDKVVGFVSFVILCIFAGAFMIDCGRFVLRDGPADTKEEASVPEDTPAYCSDQVAMAMEALAQLESGGDYKALGPMIGKNRAIGRYQVMGQYVDDWSQEILGRTITKREFYDSPELQDAIARGMLGKHWAKHGNIRDVASIWFTGQPYSAATAGKSDVNMSNRSYVAIVERNFEALKGQCADGGGWTCPTTARKVTSTWGWRTNPRPAFHDAWDMRAGTGDPVMAAHAGTVVAIRDQGEAGCGKYVDIQHARDKSLKTRYCHLSAYAPLLTEGKRVSAGEQIGKAGSTGNARESEPHLHFEVIKAGSSRNPNPALYLPKRCSAGVPLLVAQR